MNDQTVKLRRLLAASREQVFDAWLDPNGMREWMRPPLATACTVTLEPRIGGRFRIVMALPQAEVVNWGEIVTLERPSKLQFTWTSSRWDNQETLVTIELREAGAHCELILTHDRVPPKHPAEQLMSGWNAILENLARSLG